jgi:hypothetical protein
LFRIIRPVDYMCQNILGGPEYCRRQTRWGC